MCIGPVDKADMLVYILFYSKEYFKMKQAHWFVKLGSPNNYFIFLIEK